MILSSSSPSDSLRNRSKTDSCYDDALTPNCVKCCACTQVDMAELPVTGTVFTRDAPIWKFSANMIIQNDIWQ